VQQTQPSDLSPVLHDDHSLTLTEGVKLHSAPEGQCSLGVDKARAAQPEDTAVGL